jgi:hypothetical protein
MWPSRSSRRPHILPAAEAPAASVSPPEIRQSLQVDGFVGAGEGNRTPDLRFTNMAVHFPPLTTAHRFSPYVKVFSVHTFPPLPMSHYGHPCPMPTQCQHTTQPERRVSADSRFTLGRHSYRHSHRCSAHVPIVRSLRNATAAYATDKGPPVVHDPPIEAIRNCRTPRRT